jgi:hypothetical protein
MHQLGSKETKTVGEDSSCPQGRRVADEAAQLLRIVYFLDMAKDDGKERTLLEDEATSLEK